MKKTILFFIATILLLASFNNAFSQTSWTGNVSTNWNTAGNWTAGVPTTATNVIIGDASFTGANQPSVNVSASCNSLTIGTTVASTLTLRKNLVVNGNFTINANGTVSHPNSTMTVKGNWTNNGTYATTNNAAKIVFGGTAQLINGTALTTFRKVTVNTGTVVTLGANTSVSGSTSYFYVYGTFDPGQSPTYALTSTVSFKVYNNGKIKVNAATFAANYVLSGTVTLNAGSIVEYSSTTVNQTVSSAYTYSTLIISGTGTKSLAANLPSLTSGGSTKGNIYVTSGTFDLGTYTANRSAGTGGELNISNGAFLKIGGASNFPSNYNTRTFALSSTVEYNGTAQTISAQTYGNLTLSSGSGAATKTLPATAFTVEGNFTSTIGSGTSVSYTSASDITINGNVNIGASTTFNGNSNTHIIKGNWVNNGTFTGSTGTVSFNGPSLSISGSGAQNFNNINFLSSGITASGNINVSGNIATTGTGQFTHNSGGLITMTGTSKTISGAGIVFNDLTISGSVTSNVSFIINSNLSVSGTFTGTGGTVIMPGTSKTISGAGTIAFGTLQLTGTITTASGFSISTLLDVSGTFSASAGTATFTGTSILSGTANLYNVTINGTSLQLSASSVLGIANTFTITAGTLNVTSTLPNTVNFNGTGAQNVNAIAYNNLTLSNGGTKTAAGGTTVNGNLTISASTSFAAGTYTHTVLRNWVNNGTFTASTSTVQFTGTNNATITGATTFNILTINKSSSTNSVSLLNDITAATVNMTTGKMLTGANKITITTTRTGNGIILGTITRTHAFSTGTAYAFEGPDNTITFSAAVGVTSITVTVTPGSITDFSNGSSVNREYNIAVTGTSYTATLRLHYEDAELNGNNESNMGLWNNPGSWTYVGKTANNTTNNYVEQSGLTNIASRWTCGETPSVVKWTGVTSSAWTTASNWTVVSGAASTPPATTDIVQIGTGAITNQPTISTAVTVKGISYGSTQSSTLTLASGGSLTVSGNIAGLWTADATHSIITGSQNMTVNGNLDLSNGVNNRSIGLDIGSGTVTVLGSVIEKGNASLVFSGAGTLNIGGDFSYTSGTFTAGTGTVAYNGTDEQDIGVVSYNNLVINKASADATISNSISVSGNLSIQSGIMDVNSATINVTGSVGISSGATLDCSAVYFNVGGDWSNSGTYIYTSGTVTMNGTGAQNISAGSFNNLTVNKASGTATLTGNNILAGNLALQAGTLNLSTYTINRQAAGGNFSMLPATTLQVGGSNNFPANYSVNTLDAASTVMYNGSTTQTVGSVAYGNLTFSNGGSNTKTQSADISVAGDLTINSGATFHSGGYHTALSGNWINNGTFTASTGTITLNGVSKTLTGNTTFNNLTVNGSYTVVGSNIVFNGLFWVTTGASYIASAVTTFNGDLTNNGTLIGNGTTTFTGTSVQTIRLVNALVSASTGVVNFNGNVSPILNSNSSPSFATLNINNTAGINPTVGSTIFVAINISAGAILNTGNSTFTIYGSFTNNGTVTSTGTLNFVPITPKTIALGSSGFSSDGIVNFGGTGQMTITGTPAALNTVIISNTNSAGISGFANLVVDSNFVISHNATFNAGGFTYSVGANIESDGVLNGGTSTFTVISATADVTASAETVFNNFTIANAAILTAQTDFRVAGDFTNNGTYDGTIGVLIMTGTTAGSIGGSTTPSSIGQLTVEKTGGAVVTQNVNVSDLMFLNIFSGTLFTSTFSVTQDVGGGILIINDGATLKIGGTNSLPAFIGYGLDVNSTVDYAGAGTTQSIGNAANYGNVIISGAGNKNAFVPLVIFGNLTMSAGSLNTNTFTVSHSIAGDFVMTGGAISGTNSTYILNGTNDQALTLLSNLVKLTINKTSGQVNLGSNVTVNTTLTFTSGKISTGNYSVVIPSGGTVTGAAQATGWVKGNLQKNVATGSSVSRTFEIGDANYYTPPTMLFASVSTAGNLTGKVTINDHPEVDYSGIDSNKSVNRYWSFTNSGIGFTTATATLNWLASDLDAGTTTANFKTASYSGGNWTLNTVASPLATSIQATGLTGFGDFAIGERTTLYRWTGQAFTADWTTAKNWTGGIPTTAYNTLIPNGINGGRVYPNLSTGTGTVNNLTIENASTLTVSSTGTLQVSGVITNSGILTASDGTIEYNGSAAQTIPSGLFANNTIKNLIISNNVSLAAEDTLTGTLSIATGKTLTTNDDLHLKSTASGTARIASLPVDGSGNATAFINGKVYIERYIPMRKAWRLLSAPVKTSTAPTINQAWQEGAGATSFNDNPNPGYGVFIIGGPASNGFDQGITLNSSIKVFNNASGNFVALPSSPGTNTAITNYPGYFLYARGDRSIDLMAGNAAATTPTTLRMKGQVNTGNVASNVNATGYTVFGNPYPSAIDFQSLTKNNVKNLFYVWDPKLAGTYGLGGFVTFSWNSGTGSYDATTAASPLTQYIPSGEAIIIQSADGTNPGTITVKESDKSSSGSDAVFGRPGLGTVNTANQQVRVNLFSLNADGTTALLDGILTTYEGHNSNTVDGNDAMKLNGGSESIGIKRDSKMLSIERRKTITVTDTTYLNIYQMKIANYELQITADNMNRNGVTAVIKDRYSNTINNKDLDMNGMTKIDFSVNSDPASHAIDRFSIVFIPKHLVQINLAFETQRAYRQQKDIAVEWQMKNENNVKQYEVERSADGRFFTKINTATAVNTGDAQYRIIDNAPLDGTNYYRIRSIEQDGNTGYSDVVKVDKETIQIIPSVVVYPNPVIGNTISMQFNNMEKGNYSMQLFNSAGQLIAAKTIQHNGKDAMESFEVNERFAAGKYELKLVGTTTTITTAVIKR